MDLGSALPAGSGSPYPADMTTPRTLPYGSWPSPITLDLVVAGSRGLSEPTTDGQDVYVLESRPHEGGRVTLLRLAPDGATTELTPAPANVRTRVHEYGGGAWTVDSGLIVRSELADGSLWRIDPDGSTRALVTTSGLRFADLSIDRERGRVLAVQEDHRADDHDPASSIVAVDLERGVVTPLAAGHDFFSHPRVSPDQRRMSWLTWNQPDMPWDASSLWVADIADDGSLGSPFLVAGGPTESIASPAWAPDGSLVFVSDRTGWWNLHLWQPGESGTEPLALMDAELAGPQWVFGLRPFGFDERGRTSPARSRGQDRLLVLERDAVAREVPLEATDLAYVSMAGPTAVVLAAQPTRPTAVLRVDLDSGAVERIRRRARSPSMPHTSRCRASWSSPPPMSAPRSRSTTRPRTPTWSRRPATCRHSRSSPTAARPPTRPAASTLTCRRSRVAASRSWTWTTAAAPGTAGAYRERLDGAWGVTDLEDCVAAATWLVSQGLAEPERLTIRGGSAGGFTTLCAVAFRDMFAAGASYFGVGDLEALARDTHKFESRYLDLDRGTLAGRRRRIPPAFPDPLRGPHPDAPPRPPGGGRQGGATGPGGRARGRARPQRRAPCVPAVRRRGTRLPPRREPTPLARGRALLRSRRCWASSWRTPSRRWR